ncbi:unnamed protein product [Spirodela intermedia]|uniref:Uncharacterized protein n=1 Tax=Spirodela intermedia TaxID=51605 RepID=A0A7I8JZ97_SPIIN|nr:unnamed protein product [Spirodela intermedia]
MNSPAPAAAEVELYSSLGLSWAGKETPAAPRVLSLLSSFLERAIQKNDKPIEEKNREKKGSTTIFHGLRAPNLTINSYLERIFKYSRCSPSCFVLAEIYIDRFLQRPGSHLTSLNVHRLLMTSVVVAAKFIDDGFFNNAYYAKVGGVSTGEMNRLEMSLLFSLDFRLHVTVAAFDRHCRLLETEAAATAALAAVERPLSTCGLTASACVTKEEFQGKEAVRSFSCGAS